MTAWCWHDDGMMNHLLILSSPSDMSLLTILTMALLTILTMALLTMALLLPQVCLRADFHHPLRPLPFRLIGGLMRIPMRIPMRILMRIPLRVLMRACVRIRVRIGCQTGWWRRMRIAGATLDADSGLDADSDFDASSVSLT